MNDYIALETYKSKFVSIYIKMARTKILATIGPSSENKVKELVQAGVDGLRLNMAHIHPKDYDKYSKLIKEARSISPDLFIVADLEGPKIRLGDFSPFEIKKNDKIIIAQNDYKNSVPVQFHDLYKYVGKGNILLIDDGSVGLSVIEVKDKSIHCIVDYGEFLLPRKGINVPGVRIPQPYLTKKMHLDIELLIKNEIDFISVSYSRNAQDINSVKSLLKNSKIKLIGKIENLEGDKNIDSILSLVDSMMVPRGDYGLEMGVMNVPKFQKTLIEKCNILGKPVITATQMLESMMNSKSPRRAEVSDIFNAVLDGTDIVMLSGETSKGVYPIETVKMMNNILNEAEKFLFDSSSSTNLHIKLERMIQTKTTPDIISKSVYNASKEKYISAILVPTSTGYTARMIARFRPECPIIAITDSQQTKRQLNAVWGVTPLLTKRIKEEEVEENSIFIALHEGLIKSGDTVIITAGMGSSSGGSTNMMRIERVK